MDLGFRCHVYKNIISFEANLVPLVHILEVFAMKFTLVSMAPVDLK